MSSKLARLYLDTLIRNDLFFSYHRKELKFQRITHIVREDCVMKFVSVESVCGCSEGFDVKCILLVMAKQCWNVLL